MLPHAVLLLQINVTETHAEIDNLTTGTTYKFYVVSFNEHGTSVPSSIVLVNVSASCGFLFL